MQVHQAQELHKLNTTFERQTNKKSPIERKTQNCKRLNFVHRYSFLSFQNVGEFFGAQFHFCVVFESELIL